MISFFDNTFIRPLLRTLSVYKNIIFQMSIAVYTCRRNFLTLSGEITGWCFIQLSAKGGWENTNLLPAALLCFYRCKVTSLNIL